MKLTVKLNQADWQAFNCHCMARVAHKEKQTKKLWLHFVLWAAISFAMMMLFNKTGFRADSIHLPTLTICGAVMIIFIAAYIYQRAKMYQQYQPKQDGWLLGEKTYGFDEQGIAITSQFSNTFCQWQQVDDVVEHKGAVYIYLDTIAAFILNADSFENDQQKEAIMSFVKAQMMESSSLS